MQNVSNFDPGYSIQDTEYLMIYATARLNI